MNVLLVLTILLALQHAAAKDEPLESITLDPELKAKKAAEEKFDKEIKEHFSMVNDYRRKIAKNMSWPNMNELKFGGFESNSSGDWLFHDSGSFKESTKDLITFTTELINEYLSMNKTICEGANMCSSGFFDPIYTTVKCSVLCYDIDCILGRCGLNPKRKVKKVWKDQPTGEPGSACEPGRFNKDGLCSLDPPPTTTTTTTTTTAMKPPPPTTTPMSSDSSTTINILVFCLVSIASYLCSY